MASRMLCWHGVLFNETATTETYTYVHTLSRPDALPICHARAIGKPVAALPNGPGSIDRLAWTRSVLCGIWAWRGAVVRRDQDNRRSPDRRSCHIRRRHRREGCRHLRRFRVHGAD